MHIAYAKIWNASVSPSSRHRWHAASTPRCAHTSLSTPWLINQSQITIHSFLPPSRPPHGGVQQRAQPTSSTRWPRASRGPCAACNSSTLQHHPTPKRSPPSVAGTTPTTLKLAIAFTNLPRLHRAESVLADRTQQLQRAQRVLPPPHTTTTHLDQHAAQLQQQCDALAARAADAQRTHTEQVDKLQSQLTDAHKAQKVGQIAYEYHASIHTRALSMLRSKLSIAAPSISAVRL